MTPETANKAIERLSDAMSNTPQDKQTIQQILAEIRQDHPETYDREVAIETSIVHEAVDHLQTLREDVEGIQVPLFIL
jgi:hypothetical protein